MPRLGLTGLPSASCAETLLTSTTLRFAPRAGPLDGGLASHPAGSSLRIVASGTLKARPMRVSTLVPLSFSCARATPGNSAASASATSLLIDLSSGLLVEKLLHLHYVEL